MTLSRRDFLRAGGGLLGAAAVGALGMDMPLAATASAGTIRRPDQLPDPSRPAGTVDASLPFDHVVVLMMENHSFDNYLGMLSARRAANGRYDGLTLGAGGRPTNTNPSATGPVRSHRFATTAQGPHVSQTWNATHHQIDHGRMDGFVTGNGGAHQAMGYWDASVLPFAYSFASTFTSANRWFASAPCQTYPNRRFLMAATAYGNISTDSSSILTPTGPAAPPPNGTIFDRFQAYGVTWANYYTDLPQTAIIPSVVERYPTNLRPIGQFLLDCAAGRLPDVSFVDPEFGALGDIGAPLAAVPGVARLSGFLQDTGGDEEDPQDLAYGENFAYQVVNAVLRSPAWRRILFVYTFDEHGGYYDHVPPPAALPPDTIRPHLAPGDVPGGYNLYGPRVPAVVASAHARRHGTTNVVHDHTSILATIERKWNLPFLTYRDANAATVADFLAPSLTFPEPPTIATPQPFLPRLLADLEAIG